MRQGSTRSTQPDMRLQGRRLAEPALSLILVLALLLSCLGMPIAQQALASGATTRLWKTGNINYSDGAWNAHIFCVDDGEGEAMAYCVEPAKNSPDEGSYAKSALSTPSDRDLELRADLWFAYGGPGFDPAMWPSGNWDGNPMSNEDYYLASHILLSDTYHSSAYEATYGAGERFRDWVCWNITGFDLNSGDLTNPNALGRQAFARMGEVPANFEAYQINGGSRQTIACFSAYHPYGTMKMNKRSAAAEMTNGNPCYSMKGITYEIYGDPSCSSSSYTGKALVLDESGYAEAQELLEGTYYVRESESSVTGTGYAYDPTIYKCDITGGEDSWLHNSASAAGDVDQNDVSDVPQSEDIDVLIQKHDMLTKSSTPSGYATLADALFEVKYYENLEGEVSGAPTRTWTFKTNEEGTINLSTNEQECLISGDELYRSPISGEAVFPLGSYAVRELRAPASYEQPDESESWAFVIASSGAGEHDVETGALGESGIIVDEVPVRHDFSFTKRDMDTQRPMSNIPFLVSRLAADESVIERHIVVTDGNGMYASHISHAAHTTRTNANDAAVTKRADGSYSVDEDRLDPDAGTWFGVAKDGSWIAADDSFGALPDSATCKYVFEELPVAANEGKALMSFEAYAHAALSTNIDLGTIGNTTPTLATVATDGADGDKLVSRDIDARVLDTVSYSGLVAGKTYELMGRLVNGDTGATLVDAAGNQASSSTMFTAQATSGTIELDFAFDATLLEGGKKAVVCEELFEGGRLLASHAELDDSSQTVTIVHPRIETTATDHADGDSSLVGDVDATICDRISYAGLTPGAEYEIVGTVMSKSTGQPFETLDSRVEARASFVPESSTGTVDMLFTFDAAELEPGTQLVVFEKLMRDGRQIAAHEDINDEGQTVSVFPPSLETNASDPDDGDTIVGADTNTIVVDEVAFSGLAPGHEYVLEGTLVDKQTGRPLLDPFDRQVTASHAFTPTESTGTTKVSFSFDAAHVDKAVCGVIFEELYRDGRHLASHVDLEDAKQSIVIQQPFIQTYASSDGVSKAIMRDEDVTLIDAVAYQGLKPGLQYRLEGTVMDKQSGTPLVGQDGKQVTATSDFTPEANEGSVELAFHFDATLVEEGAELVVFERLSKEGVELAAHEDLEDARQTVQVVKPRISTSAKSDDDTKNVIRDVDSTVVDTVSFEGLAPGCHYTLSGTLMNKATEAPLVDADGNPVQAQAEFTPDQAQGSISLSFTFDASAIESGSQLVVFEKLYRNEREIASHEDIDSEEQTVSVQSPGIATIASDPYDDDQIISAQEDARIRDTVSYWGLAPGVEYEFRGTLIDKQTESPVLDAQGNPVETARSFTPDAPDGTVDVTFAYDASNTTQEQSAVIFERLYRDGKLIASHDELDNAAQTVTITPPSIQTRATDQADGDKTIVKGGMASIVDTVTYTGLTPGKTYEIEGSLMVDNGTLAGAPALDAAGNPITARTSFTPDVAHGSIDLVFSLDSSIVANETDLVVFEELFHNHELIAEHADISDEEQTVHVASSEPATPVDKGARAQNPLTTFTRAVADAVYTGDAGFLLIVASGFIGICSLGLFVLIRRKMSRGGMHEKR